MALERHISINLSIDSTTIEEIKKLTSLDFETQFLDIKFTSIERPEDYKLIIFFKIPSKDSLVLIKSIEELNSTNQILVPKECLFNSGNLELEFSLVDKSTNKSITIPQRVQIEVFKTLNEERNAIVDSETFNSITEIYTKLTEATKSSVDNFKLELNSIIDSAKNNLDEYKNSLNEELITNQTEFKNEIFNEINSKISETKTSLDNIKLTILEEINNNKTSSIEEITKNVDSILLSVTEKHNNELSKSRQALNEIYLDLEKKIGTEDNSMYDQITPSLRKAIIDSLNNKKIEIISNVTENSISNLTNYIKTLQEQRFITILPVDKNQITLPTTFKVNGMTKIYSNGLLLTPGKDYTNLGKNNIKINKKFNTEQELVITETIASSLAPNMPNASEDSIPGTIVIRDKNGSCYAVSFKGNLEGNALTASKLKNPVKINGIEFDGTQDINIEFDSKEIVISNIEDINKIISGENLDISKIIDNLMLNEYHKKIKEYFENKLSEKSSSDHSHTLDNISETDNKKHFTLQEKTKLSGIADNANNYSHPDHHDPSVIEQNETNRFVSDNEKIRWNNTYTKQEIDNKLKQITSGLTWKGSYETKEKLNEVESPEDGWMAIVINDPSSSSKNLLYIYESLEPAGWKNLGEIIIPGIVTDDSDGLMSSDIFKEHKKNKEDISTINSKLTSGNGIAIAGKNKIGVIKIGDNINVSEDGTISVHTPYTHPEKHDYSIFNEDSNHKFVTEEQINSWTNDTYRKTDVYSKSEVDAKIQEAISKLAPK